MGIEITQASFNEDDYGIFSSTLEKNLRDLQRLLSDPAFGSGPASIGAELEMYIIDRAGNPLSINDVLLAEANDPSLTLELNRYNLEYNAPPFLLVENGFHSTEHAIVEQLKRLEQLATGRAARVVPIGILPTLKRSDFGRQSVTDRPRYHALIEQLIRGRGREFEININGRQSLQLAMEDITLEGANTSFQVHYRVEPDKYADSFNTIQLITPLALCLAANSPTLFGHRLWHETRIPLFKQSIDTRNVDRYGWNQPARVNFGHGWVRQGAWELFAESVRLYPPILPVCSEQQTTSQGMAPSLAELRLHQSTIWLWNRPVYDAHDGGHLRIEMRALPAGPTAVDMVANAAFMLGLAEGLRPQINKLLPAIPFSIAEYNFYRAAQFGLQAELIWPHPKQNKLRKLPVLEILQDILPLARLGLRSLDVGADEADYYLGIIEKRIQTNSNGAQWQLRKLDALLMQGRNLDQALHDMLESYYEHCQLNVPVADWPEI